MNRPARSLALVVLASSLVSLAPGARAAPESSALAPAAWEWTIRSDDLGVLRTRLDATPVGGGAPAWGSREKALDALLPGPRAALARMFLGVGADGVLVRVRDVTVDGERVTGRFLAAALGDLTLEGTRAGAELSGALVARDGRRWGAFAAKPAAASAAPLDLGRVAKAVVATTRARFHDPRVLESEAWTSFLADFERAGAAARDDVELAFGFYALRQTLRVSHYALRRPDAAREAGAPPPAGLRVDDLGGGIAAIRARHFAGTADDVTAAFRRVEALGAEALVLDLRGNAGGNLSAMAVASHLVDARVPAGTFVGAAWWKGHAEAPSAKDLAAAPLLDRFDVAALRAGIAERGFVATAVPTLAPRFPGRVAVLVDGRTASAAEPLAHLLRGLERARLFGETTAGAMLSSDRVDVGEGWFLTVPTADYVAPDGTRLEGRGVDPHEDVDPADAETAALAWLRAAR